MINCRIRIEYMNREVGTVVFSIFMTAFFDKIR